MVNISICGGIIMARSTCFLLVTVLACVSLSGCLFGQDNAGIVNLQFDYDTEFGTIIETYSGGDLVNINPVVVSFDFKNTTSENPLKTFAVNPNDGREPITIDAGLDTVLQVEFNAHGMYKLDVYAIDSLDNTFNQSVDIRVDLRIDWTETETNAPLTLPFNPEPNNQGQHPKMIEIISNVENPSIIDNIGDSGQSVQITWQLVDELDDICQTRNGQINDGDRMMWQTLYFNTYMLHELRIMMEDGQDIVNVNQSVGILYDN